MEAPGSLLGPCGCSCGSPGGLLGLLGAPEGSWRLLGAPGGSWGEPPECCRGLWQLVGSSPGGSPGWSWGLWVLLVSLSWRLVGARESFLEAPKELVELSWASPGGSWASPGGPRGSWASSGISWGLVEAPGRALGELVKAPGGSWW